MVEAMLGILWKIFRHVQPDTSQSRRSDRDKQRFDRFAACTEILKTGVDQIGSR